MQREEVANVVTFKVAAVSLVPKHLSFVVLDYFCWLVISFVPSDKETFHPENKQLNYLYKSCQKMAY